MLDYIVYRQRFDKKRNLFIIEAQEHYNDGRRGIWTEVAVAVTALSAEKKIEELSSKDDDP